MVVGAMDSIAGGGGGDVGGGGAEVPPVSVVGMPRCEMDALLLGRTRVSMHACVCMYCAL